MATQTKRYRVLHGRVVMAGKEGDVVYGKGLPAGDTFDSENDMLQYNGGPGCSPKYALVNSEGDSMVPAGDSQSSSLDKDLMEMTVEELKAQAVELGIDLGTAKKKEDIARVIQDAMNG